MAILTSNDETVVRQKFELDRDKIVIGRHPECDVIIDDGSVSRRHAQIVNDHGDFFLQDLESRNGTFLNNNSIHRPTRLYDGAEIRICDVTFRFQLDDNSAFQNPKLTKERESSRSVSSVVIEDDGEALSHVMSELDVPSHHSTIGQQVNSELKLQALITIAHALSESVQRDEVLSRILDCLFDLFKEADRGFIILRDDNGVLQPLSSKTRDQHDERLTISRTIVNHVLETRRSLISSDAVSDDRFDLSQSITEFRLRSIMCAPLINSKNEPFGVIQLDTLKHQVAFDETDLEILVTVAMQASLTIQKLDLIDEALKTRQLEDDLKLAHEVQQAFLPQRGPHFPEYEFYAYYRATNEVGGDYYDYIPIDENRVAIIVADVVGHGVAAALLMAKVAAESRFALASTKCPLAATYMINESLSGLNLDRFVTLLVAMLDRSNHTLTYVNAGHMPPLIRKSDGSIEMAVGESGLPLGIFDDAEYESNTISLDLGDVAIMYTDGINESMDADGQQLTTGRMITEIRQSQTKTASTIGNQIRQAVNRHIGQAQPHDDICLVCIGRVHGEDPTTDEK